MATTFEELLLRLRALKPKLKAQYKVKEIGLFGSVVRGEAQEASDIDVLVEFEGEADLFDWIGLALFLEKELQRHVDVVPKSALKAELQGVVLKEVVSV